MRDLEQRVGLVQVAAVVILEIEGVPRQQEPARTFAVDDLLACLLGLELVTGVAVALVQLGEEDRLVVVDLLGRLPLDAAVERERRLEVVVIPQRHDAGVDGVHAFDAGDDVLVDVRLRCDARAADAGTRLHAGIGIGHDHRVLAVRVLEEVVNALLFHQPGHEIEVRFAVLDAVLALGITLRAAQVERRTLHRLEHGFDDFEHRLVLEDLAVAGEREEPEPGYELGAVVREVAVRAELDEAIDDAVDDALVAAAQVDGDGRVLAQDGGRIDGGVLGEQIELERERPRDRLGAREAREEEDVLSERCADADGSAVLGILGHAFHLGSLTMRDPACCRAKVEAGRARR